MKDSQITMNPNKIVQSLRKPQEEFTKKDIVRFIRENKIEMVNFRYVGGDGRLKTLNFVITSKADLDRVLSTGERVDGSSLFSYIDTSSSDLYVIPRYRTAYVNPFSPIPTVDILCSYYTSEGVPLPGSPENIVRKANQVLKNSTGLTLEAMGELEYYVISNNENGSLYPVKAQKGYAESAPFAKWEHLRCEAMRAIAQTGGKIKYGHSEVGNISDRGMQMPLRDYPKMLVPSEMEQQEIEFLPSTIEDAADQIVIARWILRMIGYKYGVSISFAPKILAGHAGNGLHIHMKLVKDGKNMMIKGNRLSDIARRAIAGCLKLAPSLTAFGNTIPISYLRLVPHQEAPTNICWGDRNRSVLVRVPLATFPRLAGATGDQTIEFRCPDGSANIHLLLAGLAVATRYGLEMEGALELSHKLYVAPSPRLRRGGAGVRSNTNTILSRLPASCRESAENLLKDRRIYEKDAVFPSILIDGVAKDLLSKKNNRI